MIKEDQRLVIVSDIALPTLQAGSPFNRNLRRIEAWHVWRIYQLARAASISASFYENPSSFAHVFQKHLDDVVLPLWHGAVSRNNTALTPAICEASAIAFAGADAYARLVCDDKWLARQIADNVGFRMPRGWIVRSAAEISCLRECQTSVVVKPCFGGASMGVTLWREGNNSFDLEELVLRTLRYFGQPVLIEECTKGREIMVTLVGTEQEFDFCVASEFRKRDDPTFFETRLFDSDLKKNANEDEFELADVSAEIGQDTINLCQRAFRALGDVHHIRIDGRLGTDGFQFLEFSPTPNFGRMGALAHAAATQDLTLGDILRRFMALANITKKNRQNRHENLVDDLVS